MAGESATAARNHLADAGVAELPEGWDVAEVGDLLADERGISVGVMYPGDHCEDGIPLIKAGDLQGSVINARPSFRISREIHHEYRRTELSGGELVMTLVGNVGQCAVVPSEMRGWNVARAVAVIRLRDPSDAHYVQQCLLSRPLQHLMDVWCNTTVQATLNLKEIRQLPLPWPPKSLRGAIAHFGKMLDDKIELNRRMNATLEGISRAIFKSWFVDFDPVRQKAAGKQPVGMDAQTAALFPDSFEDSEIGEVPKGWRPGTVCDYADLNPESWGKAAYPDEISYVDLSSTKWGEIESVEKHARASAPSRAQRILRTGDTIFGTVRPGNGSFAFVEEDGLTGSTGFAVLRPKRGDMQEYVYLATTNHENVDRLSHLADGGAYPAVRPEVVADTPVIVAPPPVVARFSGCTSECFTRIGGNRRESRTLAALRDALLPKLLSGEIRIHEAEGMVEEAVG